MQENMTAAKKPSRFLDRLLVLLDDPQANNHTGQWQVMKPLRYESASAGLITVPLGFSTDFASVPRESVIAWGLFGGRAMRPAVVHDYLCRQRVFRREKCDDIFLEAMRADGIPDEKAIPMFLAVAAYTLTGLWKKDFDQPGYLPVE